MRIKAGTECARIEAGGVVIFRVEFQSVVPQLRVLPVPLIPRSTTDPGNRRSGSTRPLLRRPPNRLRQSRVSPTSRRATVQPDQPAPRPLASLSFCQPSCQTANCQPLPTTANPPPPPPHRWIRDLFRFLSE